MKVNILLELRAPYLTPIDADEIRAEVAAMNPRVHLIMPAWRWLEVRGITQAQAEAFLNGLNARGIRFNQLKTGRGTQKVKVQISEVMEVC